MNKIIYGMGMAMALVASIPQGKGNRRETQPTERYQDRRGQWYERQPDGSVRKLSSPDAETEKNS